MTLRKSLFVAATVAALLFAGQAFAAGFLRIPDIEGNAKRADRKGWIEVQSLSASTKPRSQAGRRIDNEGYAYLSANIFGSPSVSKSLKAAASAKKKFGEIKLDFVNDAGAVYLTVVMQDVLVSSVSPRASDDRPTEGVAFYYNKIAFNYAATADGRDGAKGGNVEFEWKVEEGES